MTTLIITICSIPLLLVVSIATYFISRTNHDVFNKKLVIAISATIFILLFLYSLLDNNTQKRNFFPVRAKDLAIAIPYWIAAMLGLVFCKLEPAEPAKA